MNKLQIYTHNLMIIAYLVEQDLKFESHLLHKYSINVQHKKNTIKYIFVTILKTNRSQQNPLICVHVCE